MRHTDKICEYVSNTRTDLYTHIYVYINISVYVDKSQRKNDIYCRELRNARYRKAVKSALALCNYAELAVHRRLLVGARTCGRASHVWSTIEREKEKLSLSRV